MRIQDRFCLLAPLLFVFFLSACEDPSSVGLVDDAGGEAIVGILPFSSFEPATISGVNSVTNEILIGRVNDPALGEFVAEGYLDFQLSTIPANEYLEGVVDSLFLTLGIDTTYAYGDMTEDLVFDVFAITAEFDTVSTRDNLPPQAAAPIFQITISPDADVIDVQFPDEWVTANNELLRPAIDDSDVANNAFNSDFNGLKFVPVSGNAILRIINNPVSSFLRGVVNNTGDGDDFMVNYRVEKSINAYTRVSDPPLSDDRILLQNDLGPNIRFNIDLSSFDDMAGVNRAALEIKLDTTLLSDSETFTRPGNGSLSLVGIVADSLVTSDDAVTIVTLSNSRIIETGTLTFDDLGLRNEIERRFMGNNIFKYYEIRFPITNTANAIVFHDTSSVDQPPSLVLTYTVLN